MGPQLLAGVLIGLLSTALGQLTLGGGVGVLESLEHLGLDSIHTDGGY